MATPGSSRNDGKVRSHVAPRAIPIHPFLIAAFPILSLYSNNLLDVRLQNIWRPLGLSLMAACMIWGLISLASRHLRKGAMAASILVLAFFSYGHVANLLPPDSGWIRGAVLIGGVMAVMALVILVLMTRRPLRTVTSVVNLASIVLVAPSCFQIGASVARSRQMAEIVRETERADAASKAVVRAPIKPLTPAEAAALPDIYYIILDAYAGAGNLQRYHHFDNTPFLHELEKRGFWIAPKSRSNYAQTYFSLPSSLNMSYLDNVASELRPGSNMHEVLRRKVDENEVAQYLRGRGYHYLSLWTGTEQTRVDTADLRLDDATTAPGSFEQQALGLTALTASQGVRQTGFDLHRKYIRTGFERLGAAASLPYPKFVFAHFSAPHPPFVFGENGEAVDPGERYNEDDGSLLEGRMTKEQYRRGYTAQVRYVNRRVLETIDAILRGSRRRPIILLQGDHGSRMNLDWKSFEKTDFGEPYSILNAYLVPPQVRGRLYDSISPVNSFRAILNGLFGAEYRLLPDRSYYSVLQSPTTFTDVTNRIPR